MLLREHRKLQQQQILAYLKAHHTPEQLAQTPDTVVYDTINKRLKLGISKTMFTRLIAPAGFTRVSKRFHNGVSKVYVFRDLDRKLCDHCKGTGYAQ
jgi:hypothetical protein